MHRTKLTDEDILHIFDSEESIEVLAGMYSITQQQVRDIKRGFCYKDILALRKIQKVQSGFPIIKVLWVIGN